MRVGFRCSDGGGLGSYITVVLASTTIVQNFLLASKNSGRYRRLDGVLVDCSTH